MVPDPAGESAEDILDLTDGSNHYADVQIRIHERTSGVHDTYRLHLRLSRDWGAKKARIPNFYHAFEDINDDPMIIRSADGRRLTYRRVGPSSQWIEIDYDSPCPFPKETEFFLEFEYRRLLGQKLLEDQFDIKVTSPAGKIEPKIVVKMPIFYAMTKVKKEVNVDPPPPLPPSPPPPPHDDAIRPPSRPTYTPEPETKTEDFAKEVLVSGEHVVRDEIGRMQREYIFRTPLVRTTSGMEPKAPYKLIYRIALTPRYQALVATAFIFPLFLAFMATYAVVYLPRTFLGEDAILVVATLTFGPPLYLGILERFVDEPTSYLQSSRLGNGLLAVITIPPFAPVIALLIVTGAGGHLLSLFGIG
jgi:hypothetical protein